ncbi:hypothetical protein [Pseudomonas alvandae]|uniref:hypothetical protein n=1 Tax=Pseudomonas canavaninivorans TaxID=2842348 RepID=UPI001CECDAE1|nr:hypothetical protein [Pseudomonas alvandae]
MIAIVPDSRPLHLSNENHERCRFKWDALDRLLAEPELDGEDATEPHTPLEHYFERDALGRLVRKRTDDGVTAYA